MTEESKTPPARITKVGETGVFTLDNSDLFTSDTHFGHENVIKYCKRPYCCKHKMNEVLIQRWNMVVKPKQRIFLLGDTAFGSPNFMRRILERLNGYKILVKGNHDPGRNKMAELGFDEVYLTAEATYQHNGKDLRILMRHVPDRERNSEFDFHLCGHVHVSWAKSGNIINVGTDIWDYEPKKLKFILDHADEYQSKMPVQQTVDEAWEERNDKLIKDMYHRPVTLP